MKLLRAVRSWLQVKLSEQDYAERLEAREGASPFAPKRRRLRWFG